jgi:hypothetical protein
MGNPTVANILKTGAVIWSADIGTALPDESTVDAGDAWGEGWTRVGLTKAPVSLMYEPTETDIKVEEFLAPVDRMVTEEKVAIETVLAELTGEYMALLTGATLATTAAAAGQVGFEEVEIGNVSIKEKKIWGFEGIRYDDSGNAFAVRFFILVGTAKLNGALEFSKKNEDYTGIPLRVDGLADTTSGKILKFQRVTAAATV